MTHAFFKALLFMAAGSIIGAMAGEQYARPDGRLPQGDAVHLRLLRRSAASRCPASRRSRASSPRTRSCSSSASAAAGAGASTSLGYIGALPDRDLHLADDLPRLLRRARRRGARARARPPRTTPSSRSTRPTARSRTPTSASPARTTSSPSARGPCGSRWACSPCWRVVGGVVLRSRSRRRGSTTSSSRRSRTRKLRRRRPERRRCRGSAWCSARVSAWPASPSPTSSGCAARASRPRSASASRRCYALFVNKWYFDELIDLLVVRPCAWLGRFGAPDFERVFVDGTLVGGTTGLVRAGSAAVRACRPASCATTRRCWSSALRRRRPLLPPAG